MIHDRRHPNTHDHARQSPRPSNCPSLGRGPIGRLRADFWPYRERLPLARASLETATEWQCSIKTTRDRYLLVEQAICGLHTYEVPEILALPVVEGHLAYLQWLERPLSRIGRILDEDPV